MTGLGFLRRLRFTGGPRFFETGRWLFLSVSIGIVSGIGAIAFDQIFRLASRWLLLEVGGYVPEAPGSEQFLSPVGPGAPWRLVLSTVVGGLVAGFIVFKLAPEAEGHGTDAVIASFHRGLGKIRRRVPLVKMLASSVTIGSGGSAGREGPIAQVGAGFGSFLGDLFKLSNRERRILMLAGTAGGIGSIFRAPLGAALIRTEILYRDPDFEYEALLPGLLSSITGYSIYASYAGYEPIFSTPDLHFHSPLELLGYAGLGIVCAIVAVVYVSVFYGSRDHFFDKLPIPRMLRPAVGAALLGLLAMAFPTVLGMGYGQVQAAIDGRLAAAWMLAFVGLKIVATSATISSGGSGGVFGPSLVIGGMVGGAFGTFLHSTLPGLAESPAAFTMVGMGAFFAGAAKVPLAAVVMVMEMTGSYGLLVPALLAASVAYLLTPLRWSLYENQVDNRMDSPAHLGSFSVDLLESLRVRDAMRTAIEGRLLSESRLVDEILDRLRSEGAAAYAVVDDEGCLTGLLTVDGIRRAIVRGDG